MLHYACHVPWYLSSRLPGVTSQKAVTYIHQVRSSNVLNTSTVSVSVVSRHASPDQRGNFSDIPTLRACTRDTSRRLEQLGGFTATSSTELRPHSEAYSASAGKETERILWNQKVHYRAHNSPLLFCTLRQINIVHALPRLLVYVSKEDVPT